MCFIQLKQTRNKLIFYKSNLAICPILIQNYAVMANPQAKTSFVQIRISEIPPGCKILFGNYIHEPPTTVWSDGVATTHIVPDFTISLFGSSCNYVFFGLIPAPLRSPSIYWHPQC